MSNESGEALSEAEFDEISEWCSTPGSYYDTPPKSVLKAYALLREEPPLISSDNGSNLERLKLLQVKQNMTNVHRAYIDSRHLPFIPRTHEILANTIINLLGTISDIYHLGLLLAYEHAILSSKESEELLAKVKTWYKSILTTFGAIARKEKKLPTLVDLERMSPEALEEQHSHIKDHFHQLKEETTFIQSLMKRF